MITRLLRISRASKAARLVLLVLATILLLETGFHVRQGHVVRSERPLDGPFQVGCREPAVHTKRQNATIVMLAQNKDVGAAVHAIQSLEDKFNRWFHYPIVFLNDEAWSTEFVDALKHVASGRTYFEVIPKRAWGFPRWMDPEKARASIREQGARGLVKSGLESYHHMCRFYSGMFYDMKILKQFKWFWRVEPGVEFTCAITYDPFEAMARSGKRYGYAIALWEVGNTSPGLFRAVSDFRNSYQRHIRNSALWTSLIDMSWTPWPFRSLLRSLPSRDEHGDAWNFCHYWSNFEIADLDFFRSREYRDFFDYLDRKGGFYFERWGDAPVHSFAAALFLKPREIHHFEDFGYNHPPFHISPANAKGGQLPDSASFTNRTWAKEHQYGIGCRCETPKRQNFGGACLTKLKQVTEGRQH